MYLDGATQWQAPTRHAYLVVTWTNPQIAAEFSSYMSVDDNPYSICRVCGKTTSNQQSRQIISHCASPTALPICLHLQQGRLSFDD
jgi:hypothetical protein